MGKTFVATVTVLVLTVIFGAIYAAVQHDLRMSANDPQIQLVEDAKHALESGAAPKEVAFGQIDLGQSLAPFLEVFDRSGNVVSTSGTLNGNAPQPPPGVFTYLKNHSQDRFTWEPRSGARFAAVATAYRDGFVLSARSLREVEHRENEVFLIADAGWLIASLLVLAGAYFVRIPRPS